MFPLRIMNGGKCGSAGNATASGIENGPVNIVVCCALLGSLLHATRKTFGSDGACWCSLHGYSTALLYLGATSPCHKTF
jgi:hypothetical protein